ncbi:MAG: glycosyl hydrolase family 88 [Mucilaginibacter sp.]|nr:glycosyl hydrolase family 88 [Mucilaginibacter sp.]
MKKIILAVICCGATSYSIAQSNKTEEVVRRVADNVITHTTYQFINSKTGVKYASLKGLEPTTDVKAESPYNKWFYPMGVLAIGMVNTGSTLNDKKYADYALHNYDFVFDNSSWFEKLHQQTHKEEWDAFFAMNNLDACGALAAGLADVNITTNRKDFRNYLDRVADYITNKQLRAADKTLIRADPRNMTLWADDLYMSVPFLARMGKLTGDKKYFDDAIKQVENFNSYLYNERSGLYYHCYYTDIKQNGVAQWGRCNGWLAVAQVELLNLLPQDHPKRAELLRLLQRQIVGFSHYQDISGLWHQLLDKPDSYLETSVTAMFVYTVAKAVNQGWIPKSYIKIAENGWEGLVKKIDSEGRIADVCIGTGTSENIRFYYNRPVALNDTHAIGPVLLAGDEMINYQRNNP